MASLESDEAYRFLRHSIDEEKRLIERKAELAAYARKILREKGELAFARRGEYRTRHGRPGTGQVGVRLTQGTMPVRIGEGGDYVALRDHDDEKPVVELVMTRDERPSATHFATAQDVLVSFDPKSLRIHEIPRVEASHLDSVETLLETIDQRLESLEPGTVSILPDIYFQSVYTHGQIVELRKNSPDTIDG
jgi:hypothetical protein